ncbi:YihY/virulence factor BrkB family protein [Nesterenkonia haasae]|uniref:YihY/virulence factor BrkB family protein n=1 Tax=Nesterenkonia haasae TaxID=2587813 RepID=UPI001F24DCB0|nr:YihY/virulence factor BrkB family protein [Nesterenkonia haasae]
MNASQDHPAAPTGLAPHRVRLRDEKDTDIFDETATYHDGSEPGTVSAAADQPYMVKALQREEHAEGESAHQDDRKVASPLKLTKATWKYSLKRTLSEFGRDRCTDLAAGLTYYAVLSIFPALIALVSILGLVGEADRVTGFFVDTVDDMTDGNQEVMDTVDTVMGNITGVGGAGLGLAVGILLALWTASNYVNGFSRAMNRIWEVEEGRSILKLRPLVYLVTVILILLVAAAGMMLVVSGPIAQAVGSTIGLGDTAVTVWNWATPVVLILVAAAGIAMLYTTTPNIRQSGVKWTSAGALVTILVMILTTAGIAVYVVNFANYEATYGALASVIIFLFWVYIMNMVLLLGAELDAELERGRQLQAGIVAERTIMLAPRETKSSKKKHAKHEKLVASGRALRLSEGSTNDPDELWRKHS